MKCQIKGCSSRVCEIWDELKISYSYNDKDNSDYGVKTNRAISVQACSKHADEFFEIFKNFIKGE